MPVPEVVTRWNRRVSNPLVKGASTALPGMGVLRHRGRTSGTTYEVPLMVFGGEPTWYIVLTYGPDRDWVKNLEAAGEGELVHRKRTMRVINPRMADEGEALPHVARFGRVWRKVTRAPEFYAVDTAP